MQLHTATVLQFRAPTEPYDKGRRDFQAGIRRQSNPFHWWPSAVDQYHINVTEWYRGFDAEAGRATRGAG